MQDYGWLSSQQQQQQQQQPPKQPQQPQQLQNSGAGSRINGSVGGVLDDSMPDEVDSDNDEDGNAGASAHISAINNDIPEEVMFDDDDGDNDDVDDDDDDGDGNVDGDDDHEANESPQECEYEGAHDTGDGDTEADAVHPSTEPGFRDLSEADRMKIIRVWQLQERRRVARQKNRDRPRDTIERDLSILPLTIAQVIAVTDENTGKCSLEGQSRGTLQEALVVIASLAHSRNKNVRLSAWKVGVNTLTIEDSVQQQATSTHNYICARSWVKDDPFCVKVNKLTDGNWKFASITLGPSVNQKQNMDGKKCAFTHMQLLPVVLADLKENPGQNHKSSRTKLLAYVRRECIRISMTTFLRKKAVQIRRGGGENVRQIMNLAQEMREKGHAVKVDWVGRDEMKKMAVGVAKAKYLADTKDDDAAAAWSQRDW